MRFVRIPRALVLPSFCLLILAACGAPVQPVPVTNWGEPLVLAEAPQREAPALAADADGLTAFWVGYDGVDIHLDARRYQADAGLLSDTVILPLPPVAPRALRVVPAGAAYHLFWLDVLSPEAGAAEVRYAHLDLDLRVLRGPLTLSEGAVHTYAAAPDGVDGAHVVYSSGPLTAPELTLLHVSPLGLPEAVRSLGEGAMPAFARALGATVLYTQARGMLYRMVLDGQAVPERVPITPLPYLDFGDRLLEVHGQLTGASEAVWWNIERAGGWYEVWWTQRRDDGRWTPPASFALASTPVDTGDARLSASMAGGAIVAARLDADVSPDGWGWNAVMLSGDAAGLALLAWQGAALRAGWIMRGAMPWGPPELAWAGDRVYAAWSHVQDDAPTLLLLATTTRQALIAP